MLMLFRGGGETLCITSYPSARPARPCCLRFVAEDGGGGSGGGDGEGAVADDVDRPTSEVDEAILSLLRRRRNRHTVSVMRAFTFPCCSPPSRSLSTRCAVFLQIWNSGCTLCELRRTLPPYRLSRTATEGRAAPSGRIEEIGKEGRRKRRDGESISPRARLRWPRWKSAHNIS